MTLPDSFRAARPSDYDAIEVLLCAAFGGPGEGRLVRDLRADAAVETEVVMPCPGGIAAHLMLSHLVAPVGWLALAPMAVAPEWQGRRLGSKLLAGVMKLAAIKGRSVVVLGKPSFYARAGFVFDATLLSPYRAENMGRFGNPADGRVIYPAAFDALT